LAELQDKEIAAMSSQSYSLQVLIYDSTLNYSRWSTLSLTIAPDNSVTGTLEYTNPITKLTGMRIPGADSQDSYELVGGSDGDSMAVSIRLSSYPAFGAQFPIAGVASINQQGPYYIIGKLA
jgi:hypothetical protein